MKNEEMAGGGRAHHHKLALVGKSLLLENRRITTIPSHQFT